jgi:hypothetical protein
MVTDAWTYSSNSTKVERWQYGWVMAGFRFVPTWMSRGRTGCSRSSAPERAATMCCSRAGPSCGGCGRARTRIGSISLVGEDVVVLCAKSDPYRWSALVYPNQQWNEPCRLQQDVSSGYAADLDGDRRVDILTPLSCAYCTSNYGTITPD